MEPVGTVLRKGGHIDFIIHVATMSPCQAKFPQMMLCEIVSPSAVKRSAHERSCAKKFIQVTAPADRAIASKLQWEIIAYRRPRPDKKYKHLPESMLMGCTPDDSVRVCYSRTLLLEIYPKDSVAQLFAPIYAAMHDIKLEFTEGIAWKPSLIRGCTSGLRERIVALGTLKPNRKGRRSGLSYFHTPVASQLILQSDASAMNLCTKSGGTQAESTTMAPNTTQSTTFLDLPLEIIDIILDLTLGDNLLTQAAGLGHRESSAQYPSILFTCRALNRCGLERLYSQELLICSKTWFLVKDVPLSSTYLLQRAKTVRIDFSEILYRKHEDKCKFTHWLSKTWIKNNSLSKLILFVPPKFEALPMLQRDPAFYKLLLPLLNSLETTNPALQVEWDSTDFSNGILTPLSLAVLSGNEEIVRFVLDKSERCLNRNINGAPPLAYAITGGYNSVATMLLDADGIDINAPDLYSRMQPLAIASKMGNQALVEIMIRRQEIQLDAKDNRHRTALQYALEEGHSEVVSALRLAGARDSGPE